MAAGAPAVQRPVGLDAAGGGFAQGDLREGQAAVEAVELTPAAVSPAGGRAVGVQTTGVIPACADLGESAAWRVGLPWLSNPEAPAVPAPQQASVPSVLIAQVW